MHKVVVYRLALYQVLASLAFATVEVSQIVFVNYNNAPAVYDRACAAVGWMTIYTRWVKLVLTSWVTFHLFYFAVLHKNLRKFEVLYVVTSLLVPVPIASVPLITNTYGVNRLGICFYFAVNDTNGVGTIEKFSLWYVPAMVILFALSTAMVVMVIVLARQVCWRSSYEPITEGDKFWTALKQLLPLTAFPILFFVFIIPVFATCNIRDIKWLTNARLLQYKARGLTTDSTGSKHLDDTVYMADVLNVTVPLTGGSQA
ncbi:hypothetical protein EMCRGX_G020980 [Ephydatia muelleri]